jgi:hypothetical protein
MLAGQAARCADTVGEFDWEAKWIWGPEQPHGPKGFFRKPFDIPKPVESAAIQLSGDDAYTLHINGREAHRGGFWWKTTHRAEITALLVQGRNVFSASVFNAAHPGGLLLEATIVYKDGSCDVIASDAQWRFSATEVPGWMQADFDDSQWQKCVEMGPPPGAAPWGFMPHSYLGPRAQLFLETADFGRDLSVGNELTIQATLRPAEDIRQEGRIYARLMKDGKEVLSREWVPDAPITGWQSGRAVTIGPYSIPISRFMRGGEYALEFGPARTRYTNGREGHHGLGTVRIAGREGKRLMTRTTIGDHNGAPSLFVGGRPVFPMWVFQWTPVREDVANFARVGLNIFTFSMPLGWMGQGTYDFAEFDQIMLNFLDANPDGFVVPRVMVSAPGWWLDEHPGESVRYATGIGWVENGWGGTRHESFASELWLTEGGEALRRLVAHVVESPYSDRVIGFHVANGIYGEWHAWSATDVPDTSEPMRKAFAAHVRTRYGNSAAELARVWGRKHQSFEDIQIPTLDDRKSGVDGVFRDPSASRYVSDYYEAFHQATVKAIDHFCGIVKKASDGNLLTVVFYSYSPDLHWPQEGDHRAADTAHKLSNVDCFSSPHSYERRHLGEDGYFRNYPGSIRAKGKLFIDEGDDRTHLAQDPGFTHVKTLEESLQVLRREFTNAVTNDVGLWYMDQQGNWFHDHRLVEEIGRMAAWGEYSMSLPRNSVREVAVIASLDSEFYMSGRTWGTNHISTATYVKTIGELCKTGAPFDWYLMEDLEEGRVPEHKCYVFLDAFYLTGKRRRAVDDLKKNDHLLIWLYAPGYITEAGLSLESISETVGMVLKRSQLATLSARVVEQNGGGEGAVFGSGAAQTPLFAIDSQRAVVLAEFTVGGATAAAIERKNGWTTAYSALPDLPSVVFRRIMKQAGVHVFSDAGDPLSANDNWLAVHCASGGTKTFSLPSPRPVYDVFNRKLISEETTEFAIEIPAHETRLFLLRKPPESMDGR